jgi:ATP-dependent helicase/nuclease subunit A
MSVNWTEEQLQAIEYDQPRPLLVSAAAGSGKTAVLIERIFRRVMTKKIEPENILVATFTDKAATQMRQKIDEKISAEMLQATDPAILKYLRELKRRFPLAQISTIHSFCLYLIKEYGAYLTDEKGQLILQPGFTTISPTYRDIYLNQAIDEVLTEIYQRISDSDVLNEANQEDVSTSLVSQQTPDLQSEFGLFNLLENPITEARWLQDFDQLVLMITDSLSDQPVRDQLARSLAQLRSMAYFETVIKQALREFKAQADDFSRHPVVNEALAQIAKLINPAIEGLDYALNSEHLRIVLSKKTRTKEHMQIEERLNLELKVVREIKQILSAKSSDKEKWNQIHEQGKLLGEIINLRANNSGTPEAVAKMDFIATYEPNVLPLIAMIHPGFRHDSASAKRNQLDKVKPYFIRSTDEIEQDLKSMLRPLARFFETVILTERRFQQIKIRHNQIDFNDYEHYALKLLDQPEIAEVVHEKYQEIYLDEYQDTNPIQETLISRIKCQRVFMVGDLKQSIYKFRFADPGLFRNKLNDFLLYDSQTNSYATADKLPEAYKKLLEKDEELAKMYLEVVPDSIIGYTVLLNKNFRSSETILLAINNLFSWFMKSEIAEIEYDRTQMLIPGRSDLSEAEFGDSRISLEHLIIPHEIKDFDLSLIPELTRVKIESGTDLELALEALQAVKIIKRELLNGRQLSDIAILGRKHDISSIYKQVLAAYGIPVSGGEQATYLETRELRFLTQLISLLDNFQQDIPLASVMRSQIFGIPFDENELLMLRLSQPEAKYFYEVVRNANQLSQADFTSRIEQILDSEQNIELDQANQPDNITAKAESKQTKRKAFELYQKLQDFMQIITDLRNQSKWLSLAELLDHIFRIADYPDYLMQLPFSEQRLSDIERFQQWANKFEQDRGGGLRNFVVYIKQITEQKLELENFDTPPVPSNSVATMTIHASKGLEFPVVILAGANNQLSVRRSPNILSFDPSYGLSSYIVNFEQQATYSSPANAWHQEQLISMELAEEYRLLYVAMTRAEEKLYILSGAKMKPAENDYYIKALELIEQNFTRSNFQNLKSYAEIIIGYLNTQNSLVADGFPGSSILAEYDFLNMFRGSPESENSDQPINDQEQTINQTLNLPDLNQKNFQTLTIGRYDFSAHYFSEILAELKQVNREYADYSVRKEVNRQIQQSEMIANADSDREITEVVKTTDTKDAKTDETKDAKTDEIRDAKTDEIRDAKTDEIKDPKADEMKDAEASEAIKAIERLQKLLPDLEEEDPLNKIPAKLTVSEISAAVHSLNPDSPEQIILPSGMADMGYTLRKPDIEPKEDKINYSGREFGTFIHSLMQFIKLKNFLEKPDSQWENIFREQIEQMIRKQQLFAKNKAQATAAYPLLEKFFRSEIAQRLYTVEKAGHPVYREIPFTLAIPAAELLDQAQIRQLDLTKVNYDQDQTLIQGMIDLWFMEDDQAVLLDYKSDFISGNDSQIRAELEKRYAVQLKYYTLAIEKIIERPVKERYIWLFRQGKAYSL